VYTQKQGTTCFYQSHHCISLGSGPLPLGVNNPLVYVILEPLCVGLECQFT
jgi:hypothetical protein